MNIIKGAMDTNIISCMCRILWYIYVCWTHCMSTTSTVSTCSLHTIPYTGHSHCSDSAWLERKTIRDDGSWPESPHSNLLSRLSPWRYTVCLCGHWKCYYMTWTSLTITHLSSLSLQPQRWWWGCGSQSSQFSNYPTLDTVAMHRDSPSHWCWFCLFLSPSTLVYQREPL